MECRIIIPADSPWIRRLGLSGETVFESEQELIDLINQTERSKNVERKVQGIGGVTKMMTHMVSNINAGIQQDATHSTENSNVILPSQMFNAFTFKGYSQREVNEIYQAIADIATKGLSATFFQDKRSLSEIKAQLAADGVSEENINIEAKKIKDGENVDFSVLVKDILVSDDPKAKEKMLSAYREILLDKAAQGDANFGLFEVLTETFNALDLPIDNQHMFNTAVTELANKFTKEAIKIKFDGQFAVLKPGAGSQQVYEVTGGTMPYKEGMNIKYRLVNGTEVVTASVAREWAKHNNIPFNTLTPRNLRGQYVTLVDSEGNKQQLSMAEGEQLIPEARALASARAVIDEYKNLAATTNDYEGLYKKFLKAINELPVETNVDRFLTEYIESVPDEKLKKALKQGKDPLVKIFELMNPEGAYFTKNKMEGDKGRLMFLGKINTLGRVLTHQLNEFFNIASQGLIPNSLLSETLNENTGHKIEISRAEVIVDLTARDKFLIREGDDIGDITENFFLNRLLEGSKNNKGIPYHGAERMLESGEQRILFHYGFAPSKYDKYKSEQAEYDRRAGVTNVYGTPEGGTANKLLFSLQGVNGAEVSIRTIDGNMHIFLGNEKVVSNKEKQKAIQGEKGEDTNFNRVAAYLRSMYKTNSVNLTAGNKEEIQEATEKEREFLAAKAKAMYNSWLKYLDVIGTRIPGQHYQSFQGLRIVGFATGNKIFVPNEVTMLAGSDFDIDKMNMIYYSVDNTGLLSKWHPAFKYDTKENMDLSMQLPLPIGRNKEEFLAEYIAGQPIDEVIQIPENFDIENLSNLIWLYNEIKAGRKLGNSDEDIYLAEQLQDFDDKTKFKITPKGINNFTISRANSVINNPKNYPLLQKPVSMAEPQLMGSMSKEGKEATLRSKEQPSSIVFGKIDNMVGKDMIGIMASSGLKALSGMTAVYNKALIQLSDLTKKQSKLLTLTTATIEQAREVEAKLNYLNEEIQTILNGFPENFSLANINYENVGPEVLTVIKSRFVPNNSTNPNPFGTDEEGFAKQWIVQNMMEGLADDAAEIDSQLLSAATDNAKELILAKIRAVPDFGTIYTSLISQGVPFWKIVEIMTSPATDYYMKYFDREPFKKQHVNIDTALRIANQIQTTLVDITKTKDDANLKAKLKRLTADLKTLGFQVEANNLTSLSADGDTISLNALQIFSNYLSAGKEMQMLGKYLGINQGIRAKAYDLYSFTKAIESHLLDTYNMTFNFTDFLNSLNDDKKYAKSSIEQLNSSTTNSFNILYVLANATNFEKQLQGFSVTNQMLKESTYKMNGAYEITNMLENYSIRQGSALNEEQFNEVQKFIDNTVLLHFLKQETLRNNDPLTRPVFYDGEVRIDLTNKTGRLNFVNWVHNKFIPSVKLMPQFERNQFVEDLTYETVRDYLNGEPFNIVRMTYDTTNAISEETKAKADNYKDSLNDLRYAYDKDASELNTNNIFNVLFWYNTLVNKGGTGKYSWAKMQNELIMNDENHPFRRLAQLQGSLGKNTSARSQSDSNQRIINDISFDPRNLLLYHMMNGPSERNNESEEEEQTRLARERAFNNEPEDIPEDLFMDFEDRYAQEMEFQNEEESEREIRGLMSTIKRTRKGKAGTNVMLVKGKTSDGKPNILEEVDITVPSIIIPYDIQDTQMIDLTERIPAADSTRAFREIESRLSDLNPEIDIQFVSRRQLMNLPGSGKTDHSFRKALVLNGKIYVNKDIASISDVIHEYGHIFLHTLKYESLEMYNNLISLTRNHERYNAIKANYPALQNEDLDEEVFITIFGETMQSNLQTQSDNNDLLLNFADYTKSKLEATLNREVATVFDLTPLEVSNLTIQDAINLIGDNVMHNRIDNIYNHPIANENEIVKLKDDLVKEKILNKANCG